MERLQKVIANSGYCSRRKAEEFISAGKVKVNDVVVTTLGTKVTGKEEITVNGNMLVKEEKEYYLLNKPTGYISTSNDDKGRRTVVDLIPTKKRIYPVGRLDYDTSGLLLLTNDGDFANLMMHPSHNIQKVYYARVKGIPSKLDLKKLKDGVIIENYKVKAVSAKLRDFDKKNNSSYIELIITDGKYHQVKLMFESIGYPVKKLKRTHYAFLTLEGLVEGEYRSLKPKEVKKLYNEASNK